MKITMPRILPAALVLLCSALNGCADTHDSSGRLIPSQLYTMNVSLPAAPASDKIHVTDNRAFVEEGGIGDGTAHWIASYYPDTPERRLVTIGFLSANFERSLNNLIMNTTVPEVLANDVARAFGDQVPDNIASVDVSVKKMWVSFLRDDIFYEQSQDDSSTTSMLKSTAKILTIGEFWADVIDSTNIKFGYNYDIAVTVVKTNGVTLTETCKDRKFGRILSLPEEDIYETGNEMLSEIDACIAKKITVMR
ncbi:hypothetical protein [Succinimonas sp.]|uniref:hypothetical protein n=1 Tax=Succinimonas sp. TaxID=1936151 RepID=UPI0038700279